MDENPLDRDRAFPLDDLSPALRRAVERVLREPMPENLAERALAAARRVEAQPPQPRGLALRRGPRTAWPVLALAASIGLVAVLVWSRWGGQPDPNVVQAPSNANPGVPQPVLLPEPPPVSPGPVALPGDRLPTLWAYRQAAGQSPEALDALLDRDARWMLRPEPQSFHAGASLGAVPLTL